MIDVVVVGAGMAGLICAQQLCRAGYTVVVVEKSRGLGGRVATRRLQETCADHGVRYLEPQGDRSRQLIQVLSDRHILKPWIDTVYTVDRQGKIQPAIDRHPRYVAPDGITAVAKFLAAGLEIWRSQRVVAITPAQQSWNLTLETADTQSISEMTARAIVLAIPAPQALALLEPASVPAEVLTNLRSVEFNPCLTAIATYSIDRQPDANRLPWRVITAEDAELDWIGLDSSKRPDISQPVFVLQSSAAFAQLYLEAADLQAVGQRLLTRAAQLLIPWLAEPESLQVHRWRYAFVKTPWRSPHLTTQTPLPLVCSGDWCGGAQIEAALTSGESAAAQINALLEHRELSDLEFSTLDQVRH